MLLVSGALHRLYGESGQADVFFFCHSHRFLPSGSKTKSRYSYLRCNNQCSQCHIWQYCVAFHRTCSIFIRLINSFFCIKLSDSHPTLVNIIPTLWKLDCDSNHYFSIHSTGNITTCIPLLMIWLQAQQWNNNVRNIRLLLLHFTLILCNHKLWCC